MNRRPGLLVRRLLVIGAGLGLMLALEQARGTTARTSLAAIGFVVLAAFTVGELAPLLRLPRITGYIVSGMALGPGLAGVLPGAVVADMDVFNTLALGLIALSAGLMLDLRALVRVARTMLSTIAGKLVLLLAVVGGGLYLVHRTVWPLPVTGDEQARWLAAVLAVLCLGSSPSIALAMVYDRARGRLTDLTLGMAVVKDVLVILALAVTMALSHAALAPAAGPMAPVVGRMAEDLGLSIALGAALGLLLIVYLKYIHRELLLAAVCAVLLTAEVAADLHLELLLVFISAGFVVRNASRQDQQLLPALSRVSLPVFVVFFTTAGAEIDLGTALSVLPIAAGIAAARLFAYYLAGRLGAWVGREGPAVRANAWLAYAPQAGVTAGLVLVASRGLPELAAPILGIGLATVAINLLVGPVLMGLALARAGDIPGRVNAPSEPAAGTDRPRRPALAPAPAARRAPARESRGAPPAAAPPPSPPLTDPRLEAARARLAGNLRQWADRLIEQVIVPLADSGKLATARLVAEYKQHDSAARAVREVLARSTDDPSEGLEGRLREAWIDLRAQSEALPDRVVVAVEAHLLRRAAGDGPIVLQSKLRKRLARAGGLVPRRAVPVRLAARARAEPSLMDALAEVVPAWFEARGEMIEELARLIAGDRDVASVKQALPAAASAFVDRIRATLDGAVEQAVAGFHQALATLGGPSAPPSRLGLFEIEQHTQRALAALGESAGRGRALVAARLASLQADALDAQIATTLEHELERVVRRPLALLANKLAPMIREFADRLPDLEPPTLSAADPSDPGGPDPGGPDPLERLLAEIDSALDERTMARLRGLQMKHYRATQESLVLARLAAALEGVPARLVVPERRARGARGTDLPLVPLEPARRLEEELLEGFATELADTMRPLGDLVSAVDQRAQQALMVASYGVGLARAGDGSPQARRHAAREPVMRAHTLLEALLSELSATAAEALDRATQVAAEARGRVAVILGRRPPDSSPPRPQARRGRRWTAGARDRLVRSAQRVRRRGEALVRATLRRPEVRDWMLRTGGARLDAVAMRDYLARHHAAPDALDLPAAIAALLSPRPVDDHRLATAHRRQLDLLVTVLEPGKAQDTTGVLIEGERGSGRSSVINILAHRLARRRVVWPDARYHARAGGPLAAVAVELGVDPEPSAVAAALRRTTTIVLLDDLERFLRPSVLGIDDLDRFLRLVRLTGGTTHWVVTAQTATVGLFDPFVHLSESFGRRIHLAPLEPADLDRVIQTRVQISGLDIRCVDGSRRTRLRPREAHTRYIRTLARLTGGNLRRALLSHARSITSGPGGALVAREPRAPGLPFLRQLGAGPLAALSLVARYVDLSPGDLADGLALAPDDVDRFVLPLKNAGLVRATAGRSSLAIPPELVDVVCQGLAELGLRGEATR